MSTLESRIHEVAEQHVDDHAQTASELADAIENAVRPAFDELQAERDHLRSGGQEIGKVVRMLSDLIRDAFQRSADDPIAALHMLGDYLAVIPDGDLDISEHHRIYRALEEHRAKGAELQARVDDLTGQVAGTAEAEAFEAHLRTLHRGGWHPESVVGRNADAEFDQWLTGQVAGRDALAMILELTQSGYRVEFPPPDEHGNHSVLLVEDASSEASAASVETSEATVGMALFAALQEARWPGTGQVADLERGVEDLIGERDNPAAQVQELRHQVAGRDATISWVRDLVERAERHGYDLDPAQIRTAIDGDPADDGSQK
jgi:hypothetical protein